MRNNRLNSTNTIKVVWKGRAPENDIFNRIWREFEFSCNEFEDEYRLATSSISFKPMQRRNSDRVKIATSFQPRFDNKVSLCVIWICAQPANHRVTYEVN